MKKKLSLLISIILLLTSTNIAFAELIDIDNHWSEKEVKYMVEKGIINGYPDGSFKPENNITRAEFYKLVNELIRYEEKAKIKIEDVKDSDWFYEHVQKGVKANYIKENKQLNPNINITRKEVAEILSTVFEVEENLEVAKKFKDYNLIPKELRGVFGGLTDKGYLAGYPDVTVKPKSEIKRSEAVKMLHNISGQIINIPGIYNKNIKTNLIVSTKDIILKDLTIEGNLYLTEGIGEGDVTLDNVIVKGDLSVKGGGKNSIIIKNSKLGNIKANKSNGIVRVVLENTTVDSLKVLKEAKIELTNKTKIKEVELDGKINLHVEKGSTIVKLDTISKGIEIDLKGNIEKLNSKEDLKVNNKIVKKGDEKEFKDGKETSEVSKVTPLPIPAPTPTPPTPSPTPTPGDIIIYINEADQELEVGETLWLTTKVEPSNATNKKIIWKSSDDTIAEIDKYGRVTGIALGEVTITATLDIDNSKKANCLITVIPRGDEYAVIVDGISKNIISDGIIYEENNKLWAPLRFIGEGLNVEVLWDSNIREVVIIDGEIPIRINNQYSNIINDNAFWDVEYICFCQ